MHLGLTNGTIGDPPRRRDPCLRIRGRDQNMPRLHSEINAPKTPSRKGCRDFDIGEKFASANILEVPLPPVKIVERLLCRFAENVKWS